MIAPRFASKDGDCNDTLAESEVSWSCAGDSWRSGGVASTGGPLTSYDFADEILQKLARKQTFPNLRAIVFAGHNARCMFTAEPALPVLFPKP